MASRSGICWVGERGEWCLVCPKAGPFAAAAAPHAPFDAQEFRPWKTCRGKEGGEFGTSESRAFWRCGATLAQFVA